MKRTISALLLLVFAAFGQSRGPLVDYALVLEDTPVARMVHSPLALQSAEARAQTARIRAAQAPVLAELQRRKVLVGGSSQVLVNAIFVRTTPQIAAELLHFPGVAHVIRTPKLHLDLNTAVTLTNVDKAWSAISGGAANAGAGIKIGIIDTGIDQNHAGFHAPSLKPPTGFPKGDSNYTNNKVIVARSYVALDSYVDPTAISPYDFTTPDDTSPRDRVGHGTAIAMIAAGVQNTGPQATIQGVAPGAFLGNYKIFGSPGVNDYALDAAFVQALQDAVTDGMDIVTLSLGEGNMPTFGPLDVDPYCSSDLITPLPCDIYGQAVEAAVGQGLVVVAAAGNDGSIGALPHTLSTIHTPGTAPSAITVGATLNQHALFQALHVSGTGVPTGSQTFTALFDDGPRLTPPAAPILDVTKLGDNGLACAPLAAGSLSGAIAFIQRGTCTFNDKINYAENAGAIGVVIYQQPGINTVFSSWGAQDTGIPALMIGYNDGLTLKSIIDANPGVMAQFDQAFTPVPITPSGIWPNSSRGPSIGCFTESPYQTFAVKPELVAPGADIYTAAQKLDPNGDTYNPTGYAGVTGTSYAVPFVAGAVALVKQQHPGWTAAQLKSAVVNTAAQGVTDTDGTTARVNVVGAGLLSASDALNVAATLDPATIAFGIVTSGLAGASHTVTITNVSSAPATFTFTVSARDSASASVKVSPSSVQLNAGASGSVTVSLTGALPAPGSYEGFIVVTGPAGAPTLRMPYLFLVQSSNPVPADIFPVVGGGFLGAPGDIGWRIDFRVNDAYGMPVIGTTYRPLFSVLAGGGQISSGDPQTYRYGVAGAFVNLGPEEGPQTFKGTLIGTSLSVEFDGFARNYPTILAGGVVDAASYQVGQGLAPGSYIAIYGSELSDDSQVEPTQSTLSLPVSLSDVSVSFDNANLSLPGHLYFVSPGQIDVQIPWEFEGQSPAYMKVTVAGNVAYGHSSLYTVPLATYLPGFFMNSGTAADARDNTTGALITASNPATAGEVLQLYANGLGPVTSQPASGEPASASPLSQTTGAVTVMIGGKPAQVYNGVAFADSGVGYLTPGFVGLYQVDIQVPSGLSSGPQPITISVGGQTSVGAVTGLTVNLPVK